MTVAMYPGVCDVCEHVYPTGAEIAPHKNSWVHLACSPGGDDE